MAGAMAVSAMATVVSADQDAISLTYDLKTYINNVNKTAARATVVANYEGSYISTASKNAGYVTFGADNSFVTGGDIFNTSGDKIGTLNTNGTMKEFEFTARPYKDVVNDLEEKYQTFKATSDAANVDGAYYDKNLGGTAYNMPIAVGNNVYGAFDLTKYDLYDLGYSVAENAAAAGVAVATKGDYAVRDAVAKMTYEIPNTVYMNTADGWGWIGDITNWSATLSVTAAEGVALEFFGISLMGDVTMTADLFAKGFFDANGTKRGLIKPDTALVSDPTTVAIGAFTAGAAAETVVPFKSTLKPGATIWTSTDSQGVAHKTTVSDNDVIAALESRKAGGNYYTRPLAVINDAIANHDNVVFTFTSYNGYVGTEKSHLAHQWVNIGEGYTYQTSAYDWYNPTFGQHLYTNVADGYSLFDSNEYDMYGSYSSAWGINLFTGAVVVNKDITMQLSDTDTFNWGNNTLS
ncbi:MAG: hypothetical protein ACI4RG_06505, partial [Huintestinicola sp.]